MSSRLALALAAFIVSLSGRAEAQNTNATESKRGQCIASYESGLSLRKRGAFTEAIEAFAACARRDCPALVSQECTTLMEEVMRELPSVIFLAKDHLGEDVAEFSVSIDGKPVTQALGRPMALDPGKHVVTFERKGVPPASRTLVLAVGERKRRVEHVFAAPGATLASTSAPSPSPSAPPPTETSSPVPAASVMFGAVGLLGIGAFTYFGLHGLSLRNDYRAACGPVCPDDNRDEVKRSYLFADIALGVGVLSLGAAAYFFFSRPAPTPTPTTTARGSGMWNGLVF